MYFFVPFSFFLFLLRYLILGKASEVVSRATAREWEWGFPVQTRWLSTALRG